MIKNIFLLFLTVFAGCKRPASVEEHPNPKPLILVSIAPYKFLVEQIGGEALRVQTIIPESCNPHAFEPTSRQVLEMTLGQIWFRIGEPFEDKIRPLLKERNLNLSVYDLRNGIELLDPKEGACRNSCTDHLDRHIWLSPKLASFQADMIATALSERFPEKKELFKKNLKLCQSKLLQLDLEIHELLDPLHSRSRVFVVSHPAFGYFCRDYQKEQLSVEYDGKDPRPKHLEKILAQAKEEHAGVVFTLPQYNNKGAQLIAKQLNIPIRTIDPYSQDYFHTMRKLAHLIANPEEKI